MAWFDFFQDGCFLLAALDRVAAARVEIAAGRRVARVGHLADQLDAQSDYDPGRTSARPTSRFSVGVQRVQVELFGLGHLDQLADVHHGYPVARYAPPRSGVRDEQVGQVKIVLQLLQQVEGLRRTDTSSAETGSSAITSLGRVARARAMPMRWRSPPLKACG